ncbi:MAG: gliding motility-associated C-terminal domain-containing protein [Chitinophagales bacterium]|nr:gliding motility-associated C-terminal domain-containing protein [Chitinophagales bacterium]HRP38273.1 PKD domain-containing protein [Chitinophagales bacterium]
MYINLKQLLIKHLCSVGANFHSQAFNLSIGCIFFLLPYISNGQQQCPKSANGNDCGAINPTQSATGATTICASASQTARTITFNYTTAFKVDQVCIAFGDGQYSTITPTDTSISATHTYNYPASNLCPDDPPVIFDVVANFYKSCSSGSGFSYEKLSQQVTVIFDPRPKIANISTQCLNDQTCVTVAACTGTINVGNALSLCSCLNADIQHSGSYTWDFGDGTIQTFNSVTDNLYQSICHAYATGGTYKIKLTATNYCGTKVDSLPNVMIKKIDTLEVKGSGPYCTGDIVTLNLAGSGGATFVTSITNGPTPLPTVNNPNSTSPSVKFLKNGIYTITVNYGTCKVDKSITIIKGVDMKQDTIPDGCFTGSNQINLSDYYKTTNSSQTNSATVSHNGTPIFTGGLTTVTLPDTGIYTVSVICSTSCNTITYSQSFKIRQPASISVPPDTSICLQSFYNVPAIPGATISGDASAPGLFQISENKVYRFIYTPGCGSPSTLKVTGIGVKAIAKDSSYCSSPGTIILRGTQPGMIFSGTGVSGDQLSAPAGTHHFYTVYTDTATACVYRDTGTITIAASQLVSAGLPDTACINSLVTLNIQNSGSTFQINWGDGDVNNSDSHIYTTSGTKQISIKFTQAGCDTTLFDSIVVIPSPNIQFTLSPSDTICEGEQVTVNTIQNPLFNYSWIVSPQGLQTDTPPQFTGMNLGKIPIENTVTVTITSRQCATETLTKSITVNPATKAFIALNYDSVCSPVTLKISNNSIVSTTGTTTYEWYKNDVLIPSATKDFYDTIIADPDPVMITYKLIVTSCSKIDSVSKTITVYPADFSPAAYVASFQGCVGAPFYISASGILNCTVSYDFGDSTFSGQYSSFDTVSHIYKYPGKYNINLTMFCACKIKSDNVPITINPGPEITVQATPQTCTDSLTQINSQSVGIIPVSGYQTAFGDGSFNIGSSNPSHSYSPPGIYTGWMLADGVNGCRSDTVPFIINVLKKPLVDFVNKDTFACAKILTLFKVDSSSSNTTYEWEIIYDNKVTHTTTFDGILPLFAENEGNYKVILTAYNNNNISCKATSDTLRLTVFPSPKADFSTDAVYVVGEENRFQFTNKTQPDNISYFWNFGDDSYSNLFTPTPKRYNETGNYPITLIAISGPCSDTAIHEVIVYPNLKIYFPNTFSPNGDGFNDVLELYGNIKDLDYFHLNIFNRLGEKVFESNNKHFKWDGYYNSEALLPDVFVYTLEVSVIGDTNNKLLKGSITLLK